MEEDFMNKTTQIRLQNMMLIIRLEQSEMMENEFLKRKRCVKQKIEQNNLQKKK